MIHNKSNCVIALGLTIMDRCPECEKIDRVAEEAERVARNAAFAARWSRDDSEPSRQCRTVEFYSYSCSNCGRAHTPEARKMRENLCDKCLEKHGKDRAFFVTCAEDEGKRRTGFLLGPYDTHAEALANVDRGRKLAEEADPKAHWYSFGTASMSEPTDRKGMFGK